MKKIYMHPAIVVVNIIPQQTIAESLAVGSVYDGTTPVLSREGADDLWDDDEY